MCIIIGRCVFDEILSFSFQNKLSELLLFAIFKCLSVWSVETPRPICTHITVYSVYSVDFLGCLLLQTQRATDISLNNRNPFATF